MLLELELVGVLRRKDQHYSVWMRMSLARPVVLLRGRMGALRPSRGGEGVEEWAVVVGEGVRRRRGVGSELMTT